MKHVSVVYLLFVTAMAAIHLQNSNGPAAVQEADRTGSPLSSANCGACHGGGNFSPSLEASLLEEGMPVTSYTPGKDYTVRLSLSATNNPTAYGFQAVALKAADNTNAGTFKNPPSGFRVVNLNNRLYAEHSSRRTSPVLEINWTAPETGSGTVRLYAAAIAANANNGISGDNTAGLASPLEITEAITTSITSPGMRLNFEVFPNPAPGESLYINLQESVQYLRIQIFSLQGQLRYESVEKQPFTGTPIAVPITALSKGIYQLVVQTETSRGGQLFVRP
ncbi:MAG: T9SS type A sorting domain-containing protein [Saprospiraceae bacterium]|jgi:hypothetical protein|nr:T9SS type A sorting domain-containing protein [Saprospiraceae bacterium]MDP4998622.1 T9SS type A sorting domain-containing protein [Saprospiraceae bacterium]